MYAAMARSLPRYLPQAAIATFVVLVAALIWLQSHAQTVPGETRSSDKAAVAGFATLPAQGSEAPLITAVVATPQDGARARNAVAAFFAGRIAPAPPFRLAGSAQDLTRARECLALAAMAEAGSSEPGQRAVMQVILNRVRHPAFAKTVCGVVFEGATRASGCQFTFTCDGSLARRYGEEAWQAARSRAEAALRGAVDPAVGNATHYHTDWVYPSWSPQLVKLAQVETHLFFRWPGYWGSPAASRIAYRGGEPDIAALKDEAPIETALAPTILPPLPKDTPKVSGDQVAVRDATGRANFMVLGGRDADRALANARKLCGTSPTCRVMGWSDRTAVPAAFPLPPAARAALQFSYLRDPAGAEIALYDCDYFSGLPRERCIPKAR